METIMLQADEDLLDLYLTDSYTIEILQLSFQHLLYYYFVHSLYLQILYSPHFDHHEAPKLTPRNLHLILYHNFVVSHQLRYSPLSLSIIVLFYHCDLS